MRTAAACFVMILLLGRAASAADVMQVSGSVAYTTVYRFDYSKDGHKNAVRFYLELKLRPPAGTQGEPGYRAEEGSVALLRL